MASREKWLPEILINRPVKKLLRLISAKFDIKKDWSKTVRSFR